jgi:predicted HicB family RNase H-like nuclease
MDRHFKGGRETVGRSSADREYSGKLVLRLDPQLHNYLALRAIQDGESLNAFVVKKLQQK